MSNSRRRLDPLLNETALRELIRQEIAKMDAHELPKGYFAENQMAERTILGAILLDNSALDGLKLRGFEFCLRANQEIFSRMILMRESKKAIDLVTLSEEMRGCGALDRIGGCAYIASLTEGLPSNMALDQYVDIVMEKYKVRRIHQSCEEVCIMAQDAACTSDDLLDYLNKELKGIRRSKQ